MTRKPKLDAFTMEGHRCIRGYQELLDNLGDWFRRQAPDTPCIGCNEAHCCKWTTATTQFEAAIIVLMYEGTIREHLPAIHEQASKEQELMLVASGGVPLTYDTLTEDVAMQLELDFAQAYAKLGRPCCFLSPENKCLIYTTRPFSCARYYVAGPSLVPGWKRSDCGDIGKPAPAIGDTERFSEALSVLIHEAYNPSIATFMAPGLTVPPNDIRYSGIASAIMQRVRGLGWEIPTPHFDTPPE